MFSTPQQKQRNRSAEPAAISLRTSWKRTPTKLKNAPTTLWPWPTRKPGCRPRPDLLEANCQEPPTNCDRLQPPREKVRGPCRQSIPRRAFGLSWKRPVPASSSDPTTSRSPSTASRVVTSPQRSRREIQSSRKVTPSHPGTTRIFAEAALAASQETGMPAGFVQLIYRCSHADGAKLVSDSRVFGVG